MADDQAQMNYIIVPLLLILITVIAILLMKYQTWCAWKLFKPKVTKQEEPVQITHLSMISVASHHSNLQSENSDITVLELSNSNESPPSKSWISKFKRDHKEQIIGPIKVEEDESRRTVLESNAIVYSGTPPSYGQSHLDGE